MTGDRVADPTTAKRRVQSNPDPAMEFWPRVEAAIFSTAISRADAEWMLGPRCHKRGCQQGHVEEIDQFVGFIARRIADVVRTEMACRGTTEPDYPEDEL